ncbi:M15 family metallopeptidase [Pseudomonas sp. DP-17]|uniref:M15 family metallopeptidase n=1 Tax=Pseudomonas sp. DP-17 TaxID=1580486 RepID=UPI001EFAC1D6|nr:M15 family metallopeptidase [Pseudomonas sp. DP-17]MCG8909292.1 M15 family metallopeptidase [Pseudomonas sp. DP-17]
MSRAGLSLALLLGLLTSPALRADQPTQDGFVYLDQVLKSARYDVRYAGADNFVGQPIDGYQKARIILTREAAVALAAVEKDVALSGLALKFFDGYRPQRAVDDFRRWAADPQDIRQKARYYPQLDKPALFRDGYIAKHSGHSRGSTVDLTLVDANSGKEVDMGSPFDFFGPISHHGTALVSVQQTRNRETLRQAMLRHGFEPYGAEWWHYTLKAEPYPKTYFDFPVQ